MNVMNVVHTEVSPRQMTVVKGNDKGSSTSFQSFLPLNQETTNANEHIVEESDQDSFMASISELLLKNDNKELREMLQSLEITNLQDLLGQLVGDETISLVELQNMAIDDVTNNVEIEVDVVDTSMNIQVDHEIQNEIMQLLAEVNRILSAEEDIPLKEKANELLPLLRLWASLKGQADESDMNRLLTNELSEKETTIWKQLVNVYEKRTHLSESNMYRSDSTITRTDVMNWLDQALNRYDESSETRAVTTSFGMTNQAIVMTEIQQHTIHVNSSDRVDKVSDEILTKFNTIVRESRFMTDNNVNQLSITLRPDNLGNMIVRFAQINGEMTVNILVSSQAAKSMLESNIHQLKHMFAPHQVVIERDVTISDEDFFGKEEELEEQEEEALKDEDNSREEKRNDSPEIDFSEIFQQLQQTTG